MPTVQWGRDAQQRVASAVSWRLFAGQLHICIGCTGQTQHQIENTLCAGKQLSEHGGLEVL